jgi:putative transposase
MVRAVQVCPGGVHDLGYRVVWCPKYRRAVLAGSVAGRCRELISEKCARRGWRIVTLEVVPGHVRLFVKAWRGYSSYVANQLEGFTWRRLREEFPHLRSRLPTLWSRSFFERSWREERGG